MNQSASRVLLFIALLFSHIIVFHFNLHSGFEFKGIKLEAIPLIQMAWNKSDYTTLTSAVVGYMLFVIFLLANFKRVKEISPLWFYVILLICTGAVLFEVRSFVLDYNNAFTGQRLRIGLLLFFMCYNIFNKIYRPARA